MLATELSTGGDAEQENVICGVLLGYFCGTHRDVGAVGIILRDTEGIGDG